MLRRKQKHAAGEQAEPSVQEQTDSSQETADKPEPQTEATPDNLGDTGNPNKAKSKFSVKSKLGTAKTALKPSNLRALVKLHPRRAAAVGVVLLLVIAFFALPVTRYKALAVIIKKPVEVRIVNAASHQGVSEATVTIAGKDIKTDANGIARFASIPVGNQTAKVHKSHYTDTSADVFVGLGKSKQATITVVATGQPVTVKILNTITKKPVANAVIKIGKDSYRTKQDGIAQVILASEAKEAKATVSGDGYNDKSVTITALATEKVDAKNAFSITPAGKIYFLSKRTGKIDVMKSNLDGTDAQVVLAATGNENDTDTILLASRNWKYLALKAKRDNKSDYSALYVIDTTNSDKLIAADEGNASFTLVGWQGDVLVYTVLRNDLQNSAGQFKIKSYTPASDKLATVFQNASQDYAIQNISNSVYLTRTGIAYGTSWYCNNAYYQNYYYYYHPTCINDGTVNGFYTIQPDGSSKKAILEKNANKSSIDYRPYELNDFYLRHNDNGNDTYYEYDSDTGKVHQISISNNEFYRTYPTPILSPSSKLTAWSEQRDGKTALLSGDENGANEKGVVSLDSEWNVYGWYTDDYLLVSKKGSELYILPVTGGEATKITDYHKPAYDFTGYGGGYGGF
jgi:hypothetical protein